MIPFEKTEKTHDERKAAIFGRIALVMRDLVNGVVTVPYLTAKDAEELLKEAVWNRDYHQKEIDRRETETREKAEFEAWKAAKEGAAA